MKVSISFVGRICLLALVALVALSSLHYAGNGVARADDPIPTYYFSASNGTGTPLATYCAVDTKLTQGSYHIFKIIATQVSPSTSQQRVTGSGPNGYGEYEVCIYPILPGGEDDLPLAFFYVSGL